MYAADINNFIEKFQTNFITFSFVLFFVLWQFCWLELAFILFRSKSDVRKTIIKTLQLVIIAILLLFLANYTNF